MAFWRNINPTGAIGDFITVFRQAGSNRWRFALLSAAMTVGVFSIMSGESWKKLRPLPEVTYINSWPMDRTEEETRAFIEANQKRKEEREELQRQYEEEGRKLWKTLGRASGMNVEEIEAKAKADEAAAKAKIEAEAARSITPEAEPAPTTAPTPVPSENPAVAP
ncbi:hypothetical protein [Novosphingobium sp.]|uniref:hypothetical protein n=1 Tax=Novosphingobium sp. TaxID=1874826 RepID=UPI001EBF9EDE|nr:hypothetical protein [Novosphingobium sp.]MBK6802035.1 hypothetical protein [Novosphingobium sp.]MBK9009354.1 hypothetical protein [Novosphingobium sp.]